MVSSAAIGAAILRHAESRPQSIAVVATGFSPLSYRDLRDYVARMAARFRELGIDRNARVAVALPSGADAALAIVATACSAVAIPIDTQLTALEINGRLASLRPRAVIVPADEPSAAREAAIARGVAVIEAVREETGKLRLNLKAPANQSICGVWGARRGRDRIHSADLGHDREPEADPIQSCEHARGGGQGSIVVWSHALRTAA